MGKPGFEHVTEEEIPGKPGFSLVTEEEIPGKPGFSLESTANSGEYIHDINTLRLAMVSVISDPACYTDDGCGTPPAWVITDRLLGGPLMGLGLDQGRLLALRQDLEQSQTRARVLAETGQRAVSMLDQQVASLQRSLDICVLRVEVAIDRARIEIDTASTIGLGRIKWQARRDALEEILVGIRAAAEGEV